MTTLDALRAARALIVDDQHWSRGRPATTAEGHTVFYDDPTAARWCALGALWRVLGFDGLTDDGGGPHGPEGPDGVPDGVAEPMALLVDAAFRRYGLSIPEVNDQRGHAAVIGLYDHAILAASLKTAAWTGGVR